MLNYKVRENKKERRVMMSKLFTGLMLALAFVILMLGFGTFLVNMVTTENSEVSFTVVKLLAFGSGLTSLVFIGEKLDQIVERVNNWSKKQ